MSKVICPQPGSQMTVGSVTFGPTQSALTIQEQHMVRPTGSTALAMRIWQLEEHLRQWQEHGRCLLAAHRGQLPSEAADLYGGGCGCPQCAEVLALLKGSNA